MSTIEIHKNDITNLHTDAVVNAANSSLIEGGGVCGAIFKAAGSQALAAECAIYGHCDTGDAVITSSCGLTNNKYIIHAVGPRYSDGKHGEPEFLASSYKKSLDLARDNKCRSVGFPLISAGIFGYPEEDAWNVALNACMEWNAENSDYDMDIVFVRRHRSEVDLGKKILAESEQSRSAEMDEESVILAAVDKEKLEAGIRYLMRTDKVEWSGGGPSGKKTPDGKDILYLAYPDYDPEVFEILNLMDADYEYMKVWDDRIPASEMNARQIKAVLTALQRGERFCDGFIAKHIENRYLLKTLLRLEDLIQLQAMPDDEGNGDEGAWY